MTTELAGRLAQIEVFRSLRRPENANRDARQRECMADLAKFIDAAWPGRPRSLAYYVARILGLPDSVALRQVLEGEGFEGIAARYYGAAWRERVAAIATDAAEACERAHGAEWQARFAAVWRSSPKA